MTDKSDDSDLRPARKKLHLPAPGEPMPTNEREAYPDYEGGAGRWPSNDYLQRKQQTDWE